MGCRNMERYLQKINHTRRQSRFYMIGVTQTLFGEACVIREWGRIGSPGFTTADYFPTQEAALIFAETIKRAKERRGYACLPVQLALL